MSCNAAFQDKHDRPARCTRQPGHGGGHVGELLPVLCPKCGAGVSDCATFGCGVDPAARGATSHNAPLYRLRVESWRDEVRLVRPVIARLTDAAFAHLAELLGVPVEFARELLGSAPTLAAQVMNHRLRLVEEEVYTNDDTGEECPGTLVKLRLDHTREDLAAWGPWCVGIEEVGP